MNKIKVLLVDDHALMRDGIRALLGIQNDIEVVGEASDGEEALAKTLELAPDVIIMDIAMPGMNGVEATRRIKQNDPGKKILVLTQYDDKEYMLAAIKAGASGYLPKRALGTDLTDAVRIVYRGDSVLYPSMASALIDHYQHQKSKDGDLYDQLTPRQREILKLTAEGRSCKEIAEAAFISPKTVHSHRAGIMGKLGFHNRTQLVKYALRKGLINFES